MRISFALITTAVLLSLAPVTNCQIQIKSADHSCKGHSDWETPACQSAWQTNISAVFLGLATDVREEDVPIVLNGESARTVRLHVTFQVAESFIGVPEKVVTVTTGGDLCGYPFQKEAKYLVYGRRLPSGEVYVSISSSTKWAKDAVKDLQYLRGLSTAPHGATIHGTVLRYSAPENPTTKDIRLGVPAVDQKVEIQGINQSYETTVDSQGHFNLSGLPPGRYTVSLNTDGEIHISGPIQSTTVDVADKGCAEFNIWIDPFAKKESKYSNGPITTSVDYPEAPRHPSVQMHCLLSFSWRPVSHLYSPQRSVELGGSPDTRRDRYRANKSCKKSSLFRSSCNEP
jgi:hypothetical protein